MLIECVDRVYDERMGESDSPMLGGDIHVHAVGFAVGKEEGWMLGCWLGWPLGCKVGRVLGWVDGCLEGRIVG